MPALSAKAAHPALVTEQDFVVAQQIRAARPASDGQARRFALAGLIHCGVCDRRLDSHWNHGRPTYRCRHGYTSTQCAGQPRAKTLYIREDHLVDQINLQLGDHGNAKPEVDRTRHRRVAAALHDSGKRVVCDSAGWQLKEGERFELDYDRPSFKIAFRDPLKQIIHGYQPIQYKDQIQTLERSQVCFPQARTICPPPPGKRDYHSKMPSSRTTRHNH
jgi:hypothetical protein